MTSVVEHIPFNACKAPSTSWSRRLLVHLSGLVRQRPSSLNPEELPPHLLRDLGLADHGFRSQADHSRRTPMDWPVR
jgi:hypothetical protein